MYLLTPRPARPLSQPFFSPIPPSIMAQELTLILLKPDCVAKGLNGEVIKRFESEGFRIRGCKMIQLTDELLKEHYAHIADKPFFPDVAAFMNSHERPQDPRFEGDVNATRERSHQHPGFYGRELNGKILGRDNTDQ